MMYLRPYRNGDAVEIHRWIESEHTLRIWSGPRHSVYPFPAEELAAVYDGYAHDTINTPMVLEDETGICGAVTLRIMGEGELRLCNVIVDHRRRGQGLGRELLRLALEQCFTQMNARRVTLGVLEENERAVRCYLAAGMRVLPREQWRTHTFLGRDWLCVEMICER